ncbi:MAG: hypothetical protein J0L64_20435, partial [Acidobacteria bacterium]|nr:hypothetical protein [Acidobacteriota bacterium]
SRLPAPPPAETFTRLHMGHLTQRAEALAARCRIASSPHPEVVANHRFMRPAYVAINVPILMPT